MNPVRTKLLKKTANLLETNWTSNGIKFLGNRGDTIIEVLLAITIVSTMLGGAYVLSNRTLNNNRQSQERGEAIKIAESQIERLKSAFSVDNNLALPSNVFCMDSSNDVKDANTPIVISVPALNSATDVFSSYLASCTVTNQSLPYYVSIEESASDLFTVRTRWDSIGGRGHNEVRLIYRVYQ